MSPLTRDNIFPVALGLAPAGPGALGRGMLGNVGGRAWHHPVHPALTRAGSALAMSQCYHNHESGDGVLLLILLFTCNSN